MDRFDVHLDQKGVTIRNTRTGEEVSFDSIHAAGEHLDWLENNKNWRRRKRKCFFRRKR